MTLYNQKREVTYIKEKSRHENEPIRALNPRGSNSRGDKRVFKHYTPQAQNTVLSWDFGIIINILSVHPVSLIFSCRPPGCAMYDVIKG